MTLRRQFLWLVWLAKFAIVFVLFFLLFFLVCAFLSSFFWSFRFFSSFSWFFSLSQVVEEERDGIWRRIMLFILSVVFAICLFVLFSFLFFSVLFLFATHVVVGAVSVVGEEEQKGDLEEVVLFILSAVFAICLWCVPSSSPSCFCLPFLRRSRWRVPWWTRRSERGTRRGRKSRSWRRFLQRRRSGRRIWISGWTRTTLNTMISSIVISSFCSRPLHSCFVCELLTSWSLLTRM